MTYLLDADVFIRAKRLHYGMDFCPAYWDWLIESNRAGRVQSVEKVGDELKAGNDDLSAWAEDRDSSFFLPADALTLPSLAEVSQWANTQNYEPAAVSTFLQVADYYLVAQARSVGHTVVTHEIASATKRKIKIPDVCLGLGIKCVTPYEMLRIERARFVLQPQS